MERLELAMRTRSPITLIPMLALACAAAAATEVSLWQFVHPQAKIVAGFDLQKAKTSPAARMLERQLKSLPGGRFKTGGTELIGLVDRIVLSSPGPLNSSSPALLVAMEGRMDRNVLKKVLAEGMAVERFKGIDLLIPPRNVNSDMVVALLNERFGLLGDRATVEAAIAAAQAGPRPAREGGLLARALELSARHAIWMVASAPRDLAAGALPGPNAAADVESIEMGLSLQRGLVLQLMMTMTGAEAARLMVATMNVARPGVAFPPGPLAGLFGGLQARAENNVVRVQLDVPLARLERGVQAFKTEFAGLQRRSLESLLGMGGSSSTPPWASAAPVVQAVARPAAPATPPPPALPQKRTIRIVGLDDGSKEITYTTGGKSN
jgi:hypothetical protein